MSVIVWSPYAKSESFHASIHFQIWKKNVSITKNSTGGVVETLRGIKLGKSTVFFKQQQSKQENVV